MKPEEFDTIVRNKLDELEQVPGLEWKDDSVWQHVKKHLGDNRTGIFITGGMLLLLTGIALIMLVSPDKQSPRMVQQTVLPEKRTNAWYSIQKSAPVTRQEKLTSAPPTKAKNRNGRENAPERIIRALPLAPKTIVTPARNDSVQLLAKRRIRDSKPAFKGLVKRDGAVSASPKPPKQMQERETEVYYSASSGGTASGVRQVEPLSRRLSLVYGLQLSHSYNPYFTLEGAQNAPAHDTNWQIPIQLRYYLLPKENRFSAFLYAGLIGSVNSRGNNGALSLEGGAEARYRISPASRKSKAYLFVRMPLYRKNLLPSPHPSSGNSHFLWYGNTIR